MTGPRDMARKAIQIEAGDDVAVALRDLRAGDHVSVQDGTVRLEQDVPAKHKFALRPLPPTTNVRMYGVVVGRTTRHVRRGDRLSLDNLAPHAEEYRVDGSPSTWRAPNVSAWSGSTFKGFHRSDGSVGTANYWLVLPLVFCENRNISVLREALLEELGYGTPNRYRSRVAALVAAYHTAPDASDENLTEGPSSESSAGRVFANVDGVRFLTHHGGCGGTREDADALCALLAAYVSHPNVAGATVLSLGCQNAQVSLLEQELARRNESFDKPLVVLEQQRLGTEDALLREAIDATFAGLVEANEASRADAPLNRLVFGVECGGSDGFSGISANPGIGWAADLLVALGGSVLLSEFPELSGVEQEFINRSVSRAVAERFVDLQRRYAARAAAVGASFEMNPSVGNIRDGLLTDAMKSAGAARKGGTSPVTDVLDYTEPLRTQGLNLLCTPGNDVESTTALVASGANVILFSTGMGTPTGNPIVPVVKIASNQVLAARMPDIIDIDAGTIITGEESVEEVGRKIFSFAVRAASGEIATSAVRRGQEDFIPWKRDISL